MKTVAYGLFGALAAVALGTSALAQDQGDTDHQLDFVVVDANNDGAVDLVEAQSAVPSLMPEEFAAMDEDNDGLLTQGEWANLSGYT